MIASLYRLPVPQLTFVAEQLHDKEALRVLAAKHAHPVVREGAVLGMARLGVRFFKHQLAAIAQYDSSPGVRESAREALE